MIGQKTKVEKTISFTIIGAPKVKSTDPKDKERGVNKDSGRLDIEFDQPMDGKSVEDAFNIEPSIDGEFEWNSDTTILSKDMVKNNRNQMDNYNHSTLRRCWINKIKKQFKINNLNKRRKV